MPICYLDRAFCSAYPVRCGNHDCRRAITQKIQEGARAWHGNAPGPPPISVMDLSQGCEARIEPVIE